MYLFTYAVDDDNTNELYAEFHLGNGQVLCLVKNKPTRVLKNQNLSFERSLHGLGCYKHKKFHWFQASLICTRTKSI